MKRNRVLWSIPKAASLAHVEENAGATQLARTLAEARGQAAPLLQVARHLETA